MEKGSLLNPKTIAELGERIYRELYQSDFERGHKGKFVAIDVTSSLAYLGNTPEEAITEAQKVAPKGVFHLLRVGAQGVYRVSSGSNANVDWVFR